MYNIHLLDQNLTRYAKTLFHQIVSAGDIVCQNIIPGIDVTRCDSEGLSPSHPYPDELSSSCTALLKIYLDQNFVCLNI